jgi:outer membrane protein OmpA-like peptidoglycan-associated protein
MTAEMRRKLRFAGLTMAVALSGCASNGGAGPFGPIASEEWTRNQLKPIEAKLAQLDARATQTDGRVTQVAAQTAEARKVADDGVRRGSATDARLTQALANRYKRTPVETIQLSYATAQYHLTPDQQGTLDRVLKSLADNPTYTLDIVGYTDAQGTRTNNEQLSWRREEVVRRYLVDKAPVMHRISFIALGEEKASGPKKKDPGDRHVSIVIYRPSD